MTDEQRKAQIAALLREREHYTRHDKPERVKEVDAQLAAIGHEAKPPAKRATRAAPARHTKL